MMREDPFFGLLQAGAQHALEAAEALVQLLENYDELEPRAAQIKEIEERGDAVRHQVMRSLHRTMITALDREDIALLSEHVDNVIDEIEEIARTLLDYGVEAPTERMKELGGLIMGATDQLAEAIGKLGQGGTASREIITRSIEINRLENEADKITNRANGELYQEVMDPITVIKLRTIYAMLEQTTDHCEDAANVLEGIVLKQQ
jgi:predicted phosphate transport protein (TIGR00153 family)